MSSSLGGEEVSDDLQEAGHEVQVGHQSHRGRSGGWAGEMMTTKKK
jgi:hypothetical protein